jgi:hypothetical protein
MLSSLRRRSRRLSRRASRGEPRSRPITDCNDEARSFHQHPGRRVQRRRHAAQDVARTIFGRGVPRRSSVALAGEEEVV